MSKKSRTYGVFFGGELVGKRTTKTMLYTCAIVWRDGADQLTVLSWHQTDQRGREAHARWSKAKGTDTLYLQPAVVV